MSLAVTKLLAGGINTGTAGAYFQVESVTAPASGTVAVPAGLHILVPSTNVKVQATVDGTNWSDIVAANTGGLVWSDGLNVRLNNASTQATVTMLTTQAPTATQSSFATS